MFPWYLSFSWWDLYSLPFYCFPLFLCIDPGGKLSKLSLLFFATLHSNGNIFPFSFAFLFFFSQLFVRPPQTTILPYCISFFLGMVLITASCTMSGTSVHSSSGTLSYLISSIYLSLPLYLFSSVQSLSPVRLFATLWIAACWFQIGKGVCQGCILSSCLFNLYAEYIVRNAGLEEAQAGIKIAGRNISNLR